jgi:hypothetical protein
LMPAWVGTEMPARIAIKMKSVVDDINKSIFAVVSRF